MITTTNCKIILQVKLQNITVRKIYQIYRNLALNSSSSGNNYANNNRNAGHIVVNKFIIT